MGRERGRVSAEQLGEKLRGPKDASLTLQFSGRLHAWPHVGWMARSEKTKGMLGEICAGYGPFSSSWSAQNLSRTLAPAGVSVKTNRELVNICCPIVVSSAGLFNTYKYLLPEKARCLPGETGLHRPLPQHRPSGARLPAFPRAVAAL